MLEKKRRSFVKSISWRVTATITTVIISYFITGEITMALQIGAVELFAKMFLYYGHERLWSKIKFGIISTTPDYHI